MTLRDELQAMGDAYVTAYRSGDTAGCAAVFTPDGVLYSAFAPPAIGRPAIAALHGLWTEGGEGKTLTVVEAAGSGDIAWARADFAEKGETTEGHALWACIRLPGGPWQVRICSLTAA
jgi:ketosteroid isomerase-like protein